MNILKLSLQIDIGKKMYSLSKLLLCWFIPEKMHLVSLIVVQYSNDHACDMKPVPQVELTDQSEGSLLIQLDHSDSF